MNKAMIFFLISLHTFLVQGQEYFTLEQAMDYAIQNHNSMRVAALEGENALWQYKEAKAIGMPKLTGNINYSYFYKTPVNPTQDFLTPAIYGVLFQENVIPPRELGDPAFFEFSFIRKNQFAVGLTLEALVFDGNYLKGLKVARMFIQLAKNRAILTEQEIRQNVARAYQNVLVAERNMVIIDKNIENVKKSLNETRIIYENGFVEELDVDRLELSLQNLNVERNKLEKLILVSYNVLKFQMAYPLQNVMRVSDNLEDTVNRILLDPINPFAPIDYEKRPEHRLLNEAIDLDRADLSRIKQGYVPSISASIGFEEALQRDKFFDGSESGFLGNGSIGLKAHIPIYDGGDIKAKIERKKIVLSKKHIDLVEFERSMTLQVKNGQTIYQNAKWTLQNSKRALKLNEKIYNKTRIKYREGVGSSLEVTQSEASLYAAQASYINSLYDLLVAKTDLDIATGKLLELRK